MSAALLALLGLGAGGGFLTKEAIDRLGDVGNEAVLGTTVDGERIPGAMEIAQGGLDQTQFKPFTITSSTGGMFGVTPGEDGSLGITSTLGKREKSIQNMMLRQAQKQLRASPYGQQMGRDAMSSAYDLGQDFMQRAGMSTAQREGDIYGNIRAMQRPEEQRQQLALEERLANQGRLGVRTNMYGGTPEQLAMAKAQSEAQNQASLMAMQQAQAEQLQQANIGAQYAGLGSQLGARDIASQAAQQQLGLSSLEGAYTPQAQLNALQQASQIYPQLQQRAQQAGAGLFGEAAMGGLEARLGAELGQANLLGNLGSGLLGGLFTPVSQAGGGATNLLVSALS